MELTGRSIQSSSCDSGSSSLRVSALVSTCKNHKVLYSLCFSNHEKVDMYCLRLIAVCVSGFIAETW